MSGSSKAVEPMIVEAARDTSLSAPQVKVRPVIVLIIYINCICCQRWIKKRSYRRKHAQREESVPVSKRHCLSPWQHFLKEYGQCEGRL